jgi:hypothetical protein
MPDGEDTQESVRQDNGHDRWLAMQAAYLEYLRTSEALTCTRQSSDELSDDAAGLPVTLLADQQRAAFERYLETRMEFLESRFDETQRPDGLVALPICDAQDSEIHSRFANYKWVLPLLVLGLLSMTAFSLLREQGHVRDLEAARDELRARLSDTRDALQVLSKKLDAAGSPIHPVFQQVEAAPRPPAATARADGRKSLGPGHWRRVPDLHAPHKVAVNQERIPQTRGQDSGARSYNFSLVHFGQLKRVGPIEVSLKSVDAQRNCVSLFILSDSVNLGVRRFELNHPVWIDYGFHGQRLQLVVDRIAGNGLHGRLIEHRG